MFNSSWQKTITLKSGEQVHLRYPTVTDAEVLLNFFNPIVEENTFILVNELQTLESEQKYLESVEQEMQKQNAIHIIALHEGKIIGKVDVRRHPYKQKHMGALGITVAKAFRGNGLGMVLMKEVLAHAKELLGLEIIELTCFAENERAISLYKKFGFIEYGRLPKAMIHNEVYKDQILMYKEL